MYYNALLNNTMSAIAKETITFRLDRTKREALDAIAKELDRDRSYLLNEAIENYIEIYKWQIAEINLAIAEADAEDFASDEDVDTMFGRLNES
ncbi:ribbon-helix-helix protein, CopG family [Pseudanabaena sp. UWO310]|nr:ribbon-helix-helix protein, CopG family [Pseudanabaena sp. UWO310]